MIVFVLKQKCIDICSKTELYEKNKIKKTDFKSGNFPFYKRDRTKCISKLSLKICHKNKNKFVFLKV